MTLTAQRPWSRLIEGKGRVCPVCGHDHGCRVSSDGQAVNCLRVEMGSAKALKSGMGWLHLIGAKAGGKGIAPPLRKIAPNLTQAEIRETIKKDQAALSAARLEQAAAFLGLRPATLQAFGCGFNKRFGMWSFPMVDGDRKPVGIHLRSEGRKLSVLGSKLGLFVPANYDDSAIPEGICASEEPLLLIFPEGLSDTMAAHELGFRAVGRPSNRGGVDFIRALLRAGAKQDVVVLADNDPVKWTKDKDGKPLAPFFPGIEGAIALCEAILPLCGTLRFLMPPEGCKDLRGWFCARTRNGQECNGLARVLMSLAVNRTLVTPSWLEAANRRLAEKVAKAKGEREAA